jgi:hypothetical protein
MNVEPVERDAVIAAFLESHDRDPHPKVRLDPNSPEGRLTKRVAELLATEGEPFSPGHRFDDGTHLIDHFRKSTPMGATREPIPGKTFRALQYGARILVDGSHTDSWGLEKGPEIHRVMVIDLRTVVVFVRAGSN